MGGMGSGRYGSGRRVTTVEAMRLDINWLLQRGMLKPGSQSPVFWRAQGSKEISKIYVVAFDHHVALVYRNRQEDGTWQPVAQRISIVRVGTNFAATRPLFACPKCGRACRDLFAGRHLFFCRKCLNLAYLSQHQSGWERAAEQARSIAKRLTGGKSLRLYGPPPKPPRMHWVTYRRLLARYEELHTRVEIGMTGLLINFRSPSEK